jgi:ribosome-associated heat shock protein Hsp15
MEPTDRNRIDVWLKLVCLFKHRGDATEACRGGHVKINGLRVKPAATVHEGDTIEFYVGSHFRKVVVLGLPVSNVSKEVARTLYDDQTPVQPKVEVPMARERGAGRPTKKERREIEKWKK